MISRMLLYMLIMLSFTEANAIKEAKPLAIDKRLGVMVYILMMFTNLLDIIVINRALFLLKEKLLKP